MQSENLSISNPYFRSIDYVPCEELNSDRKIYKFSQEVGNSNFELRCNHVDTGNFRIPINGLEKNCKDLKGAFFALPTMNPVGTFHTMFRNGLTYEDEVVSKDTIVIILPLSDVSFPFPMNILNNMTCQLISTQAGQPNFVNSQGQVTIFNKEH